MVTGSTLLAGIIGHPVTHSRSPQIHNSAFSHCGLNWIYVPMDVSPASLGKAVQGLKALGFRGSNVTVPFKEEVLQYVDTISEDASNIGAVNTIDFTNGHLRGENTDWVGFIRDLEERSIRLHGKKALVLGTGGAARAIVYAFLKREAFVVVCGRDPSKSSAVADHFRNLLSEPRIKAVEWNDLEDIQQDVDIVVNSTPLGMPPYEGMIPWPVAVKLPRCELIYDVVYSPPSTRFLECAKDRGIRGLNGLGMLVHQAAESFSLWTGRKAPLEIMRKAALSC